MKVLKSLFIVSLLLGMSGCATYSNSTSQSIEIRTSGVDNVTCTLGNSDYKYELIAPGKITVERDNEDLEVICRKAGYVAVHKKIRSGAYLGKAVLGNTYNGILPGLTYDLVTGSYNQYPDMVIVDIKRNPNRLTTNMKPRYVLPKKEYRIAYFGADKIRTPYFSNKKLQTLKAIKGSVVK